MEAIWAPQFKISAWQDHQAAGRARPGGPGTPGRAATGVRRPPPERPRRSAGQAPAPSPVVATSPVPVVSRPGPVSRARRSAVWSAPVSWAEDLQRLVVAGG